MFKKMKEFALNKSGLTVGIFSGIGLGLLVGSEFSGRNITILGAIVLTTSLCSMATLLYNSKKKQ